jgi:uncharacterized membrane protein SpoIIM required for sporulation
LNTRDDDAREQLESLLDRAESARRRLSFADLRELARLYRLVSAQLAILRSRGSDPDAIAYLNALCVRAYTHLQVTPPRERRMWSFFLRDFPATLAATAWLQGFTAVLLLTGAVIGATVVSQNPATLYAFVPTSFYGQQQLEQLANSRQARSDFLARKPVAFGLKSAFSAGLFVHNTQVGLAAFATGILAGVPTLLLVFYNGLTLGAFAWMFSRDSLWPVFWAWLLPHAVPELLAITLCSAGGLLIATAVVAPGREGIAASLRAKARPALQMVFAACPLFVIAAAIESFLRQSSLSTGARFAAAVAAAAAIASYIWYVRRLARRGPGFDLSWLVIPAPPGELRDSGSAPVR